MKKIIVLLLLFCAQLCICQSSYFNIKETNPFKDTKKGSVLLDVHQMENGENIVIRSIKKNFVISSFTASYDLKSNVDTERQKKEGYIGSVTSNGLVRFFTVDRLKKMKVVYCHTFNPATQQVSKKKLFEVVDEEKRSFFIGGFGVSRGSGQEQRFSVSPDGNYFVVTNNVFSRKKSTSAVYVYDTDLNEVFKKVYFNSEDQFYAIDDFVITNDLKVILAGKVYKNGTRDKKDGKANYTYEIHKISAANNTKKVIDLGDKFVQQVRIAQYGENLRMLGFYSENSSGQMKGGISYTFSEDDITNISPKVTPFPADVYNDIYGEAKAKSKKKKEKEFRAYYLDYSLIDEAGNAFLTAEQFFTTTVQVSNGAGGFTTQTIFHYNNILIIKFDNEGNLVWGRSIFKAARSHSYNAFEIDGKLHILLNTGKNIAKKSNDRKKIKKSWLEKSALYDIVYDENGNETYELIKENDGKKDFYSPTRGSFDYDKFIMANLSKNKRRFMVLTRK